MYWLCLPMVSLEFFIDTILPALYSQEYFLGVKAAGA
jgi:hypothetical protein